MLIGLRNLLWLLEGMYETIMILFYFRYGGNAFHIALDAEPFFRPRFQSISHLQTQTTTLMMILRYAKIKVCKTIFLNTLGLRKGVVDIAMTKRNHKNSSEPNRRGRHINKLQKIF